MAKQQSGSSAQDKRRFKNVKHIPDSQIDFSDIPELTPQELKRAKRIGRPRLAYPKQLMAIRISPDLLYRIRKLAKKRRRPYQTLMHELLESAVKAAA